MKLIIKVLILSLSAIFVFSFSFESNSEKVNVKNSLLWKIEGNGLKSPSYLFGTMHLIEKDYFYFPSLLEKIIKKSDFVVTEIALDQLNDQESMKYVYLKEGNLMDFFNPAQQDSVFNWAKTKLNLDKNTFLSAFGKMKPFILVQTVTQLNFMGKTESYELKIKDLADKFKVKCLGLETIEEQISFFDNLSKEEQANMFMENIRNEANSLKLLKDMQIVYKMQNLDSLYAMMQSEGGTISDQQSIFLDGRNLKWIPQIKDIIHSKTAFIAVGAGHLAGENGIIELLRNEGYTLTPIQF